MLRWAGDESVLPDEAVRARLRALVAAAERSGPPTARQGPFPGAKRRRLTDGTAVPCLFVLIALLGLGSLAAIGVIRALNWVLGG